MSGPIAWSLGLSGLVAINPGTYVDGRGHFFEAWSRDAYAEFGIPTTFVQDNVSRSHRGVLRGLHFQRAPFAQGKLVTVLEGAIFDVAVDIRRTSDTFGQWTGVMLDIEGVRQLYIPPGFAHGFCALRTTTVVAYKCTEFYHPEAEGGIRWNAPELAINWPFFDPIVGDKDKLLPCLKDIPREQLPE